MSEASLTYSGAESDRARSSLGQAIETMAATASGSTAPGSQKPAPGEPTREISFLTGVNAAGALDWKNFFTWNWKDPARFNPSNGSAHKWGGGAAGSASGVITYFFDPSSNWTAAEKNSFRGAFALWSAEANITFRQVYSSSQADVRLIRGADGGAYENDQYDKGSPGSLTIPETRDAFISIDTSQTGFGSITSFARGAYGVSTVVHEVGHLIGLGHGGPYNGDVDPATQQYGPLDSRLWSIMSYISPDDQTAKYYGDYPVTGTNWGNAEVSVTPQMIDVRAVQRLYGLPTNTPLDGGQVFGFHTNLTGAIAPYFDFTINTHPVVTLWDEGDGNTLDLSGFGKAATVNLNPGTFSSADGMVNNIGIAYDTRIDTVIGGGGNDLFVANADNDTIDGGGGMNAVKFNYAEKNYSVSQQSADVLVTNVRTGAVDKLTNIHELVFTDGTMVLDHTGNEGATMVSADMIGTGGSPSFLSSGSSAPAFSAPSDPGTGQSWLTDMLAASGSIAPATSDWFSAPPIGGHVDLATVLHEVPLLVGISHGSA